MDKPESIETIEPATFDELLLAYPDVVPAGLSTLDKERYDNIPEAIRKLKSPVFLTKEQTSTLVDWKLSHGKFRPILKALLQQNNDSEVENTTRDGFKAFSGTSESAKISLNILTKLKGIGPATASLLLSVYDPETAPFFSDELFRWSFLESDKGKGKGWDRDIRYNLKEYLQIFKKVQGLKQRFRDDYQREIAAVDIEKVAYVLGKRTSQQSSVDEVQKSEKPGLKRKISTSAVADTPDDSTKAAKSTSSPKAVDIRPTKIRGGPRASARLTGKR